MDGQIGGDTAALMIMIEMRQKIAALEADNARLVAEVEELKAQGR